MVSRSPHAKPLEGSAPALVPDASARSVQEPVASALAIEREISRLTWTVLDGEASVEDRRRLAELVGRQHALRREGQIN